MGFIKRIPQNPNSFSLSKKERTRKIWTYFINQKNRGVGVRGREEVAQKMCTHVSKCKNYRIKGEKSQKNNGTVGLFLVILRYRAGQIP
jgi:hypothetical protein